jgi:drug/metabolite transporter (DMT)-like permease
MATVESAQAPLVVRERNLALGAALVAVTAWASAFVGIRSAGHDLSSGSLALGRLLVGSVALGLIVAARREAFPARRDLPAIALCGLLWFATYNVVLNEAERRVDAGTAAMLVNVGPILIAIIAGVALREGFPRSLLAGLFVAFVGVVIIGAATSSNGLDAGWGAVLCLVAALAYSIAVVIEKPVLARASALQVTWLACAVGALACLPFAPGLAHDVADADASALGWTLYLGTVPTAIGFVAWAYALSRLAAGRVGSTTYLAAPIAVLLGWAILAETPPALALAGGALCLVGVIVASGRLTRFPRWR